MIESKKQSKVMTDQIKLSSDAIDKILEHATTVVEHDGRFDGDGCYGHVVQTLIKIERERLENLKFDRSCIVDNAIVLTVRQAEQILNGMYCGLNPQRVWLERLIAKATKDGKK